MQSYRITGGVRLQGAVGVGGSKNAALPIMAASILAGAPVCLLGVPRLADVQTLGRILRRLGVRVERDGDRLLLETIDPTPVCAPCRPAGRMRAGFCVLGPLLARRGRAIVPLPGGCRIGDRPVDLHLKGLAALGAELRLERGYVIGRAGRLVGTTIDLGGPHGPTVTGTANVLSAAVLARGTTTIRTAACEPEIVDLGNFLNRLGARISGLGTSTLVVRGVDALGGGVHRVTPDRIEAGTLLLAAAITRGQATVRGAWPEHLREVIGALRAVGAEVDAGRGLVTIAADRATRPLDIVAAPYPGIPTDLQAQWTALLAIACGRSRVEDTVFPTRFQQIGELRRLGAKIELQGSAAAVSGVDRLSGAEVVATDLRASASLVLAGLAAEGQTLVRRIDHLDRGYERLDEKLALLGARIERLAGEEALPRERRVA